MKIPRWPTTSNAPASGGVYVYVAWQAAQGRFSAGDLVLYGGAVALSQSTLAGIGHSAALLPRAVTFLPSLYRVLALPPDLPVARRRLRTAVSIAGGTVPNLLGWEDWSTT